MIMDSARTNEDQDTKKDDQAKGSGREPLKGNPLLPRNALYLAIAEVFMAFAVQLNEKALLANLFGLGSQPTTMLNMAMGTIYATVFTALVTIDWTAIVLCAAASFHVVIIAWMLAPSATCVICAYLAPTLSMFAATLQPLRWAFLSDQLTSVSPSHVRLYFIFIAGCSFLGFAIVQLVSFALGGTTMIPIITGTILGIFILYTALVVFIEATSYNLKEKYCTNVRVAAVEIYRTHEGKKYWEMFHIGITLTGHYGARLILSMAQKEQFRSIEYAKNMPEISQSLLMALPAVLAVVILTIVGFGVTPLLKRYNKEITDLQYMGIGMVLGCIAMAAALHLQTYIDKELKPPRRQESLLFLFNLLPTATSFSSKVFGKSDNSLVQVQGTSSTVFLANNVAGVDEYPISVVNSPSGMWMETFIKLYEGKTVSYVVGLDSFQLVTGMDLHSHHFLGDESTIFVGCALNRTCEPNKIRFLYKGKIKEVALPPKEKFKTVYISSGNYSVTLKLADENILLTEGFLTKSKNLHTAIVYEKEPGVPDIAIFLTAKPQDIPLGLYIFQQVMIAFRESFFTVGLLRFLYFQTRPNHPARPFVYSAFFFLYHGVPLIVLGGLSLSIFSFLEAFVIHVYLLYYACCTVLFIHLANKYEHLDWLRNDDED